jgi:DNA mismatch endonuclease (patch repair protein)
MADVFSKAKRSEIMSRIKGKGNRDTELAFVTLMKAHRITGWRRHVAISLTGTPRARSPGEKMRSRSSKVCPDFVFPTAGLAVFIDGCFWHGCPKHSTQPSSNKDFWLNKLSSNRQRDRLVTRRLRSSGWMVLRIWEHELKNPSAVHKRLQRYLDGAISSIHVRRSRKT